MHHPGNTVRAIRSGSLAEASPQVGKHTANPRRVAVLLNRNARRVTDAMAAQIERIVGPGNVFYSRSLQEAELFAREIVQRDYGTVVCGGGDGTLTRTINLVQHYVNEANAWRQERNTRLGEHQDMLTMPRFAFLALGTGNGLKRVVGATHPLENIQQLMGPALLPTRSVAMIQNEDEQFFFGGMGFDSLLLNDYNWLKKRTTLPMIRPVIHSVTGYFAAAFLKTLPKIMLGRAPNLNIRVTTLSTAYYVDPRIGDAACELPPGSVLFNGPVGMLAASTVPYLGYAMKAFPFAGMMPDHMQLRVTTMNPFSILAHLPSIWTGTYRNPTGIYDFLATDVRVDLEDSFPFQHSGDDQGTYESTRWHVAPDMLQLVDFHKANHR